MKNTSLSSLINSININEKILGLRFADDTVLTAKKEEILELLENMSSNHRRINNRKIKNMIMDREN